MIKMCPKTARILMGLTQEQMAKVLCIHRTTYVEYEKDPGKFSVAQAWQFCRAVKMPLEEVFADNRGSRPLRQKGK